MGSCIARQPILNTNLRIYGYELLYRDNPLSSVFDDTDADYASSETIMNSFHEMDIERVTGGKRAFVNFTEKLLLDGVATILPSKVLVVELLESILPTPEVLDACKKLKRKGYTIALDDFVLEPEYVPLLKVADIVKVDFLSTEMERIEQFAQSVKDTHIRLLAEKLETAEDFQAAKDMGFTLFQGYFFCTPSIVTTNVEINPLKLTSMELIRLSCDPNVDYVKIAEIIKHDVALSYRLLRVVNSAFFGLRYTVSNIRQALLILGMNEIRKWITLISLSRLTDDKPDELITMSLIRAKFLELISHNVGLSREADDLYMFGLMSLMNAITDMPFEEIVKLTNISSNIADPLIKRHGTYWDLISIIIHLERSEWDSFFKVAEMYNLSEAQIAGAYMDAIEWAGKLF